MSLIDLIPGERAEFAVVFNGRVQTLKIEMMREVLEDAALDAAAAGRGLRTPLLPAGTVYYAVNPEGVETHVIQYPPCMLPVTIRCNSDDGGEDDDDDDGAYIKTEVPVPYQICVITSRQSEGYPRLPQLYWSTAPLTSMNQGLSRWLMPNHYTEDGKSCMGAAFDVTKFSLADAGAISRYAEYIRRYICASEYNNDLGDGGFRDYGPHEMTDFELPDTWDIGGVERSEIRIDSHVASLLKMHFWGRSVADPLTAIQLLNFGEYKKVSDVIA